MAKEKTKGVDELVTEEVIEETVEETVAEDLPHSNPIIQMAIDQARQRFLRETAE
jgi:hypothetical protein